MKMKDMAVSRKEQVERMSSAALSDGPDYDYGLTLCFNQSTMDKLDLDSDVEAGDMIHIFAMAKVTSVSKNDMGDGEKCEVRLQITHLGVEDEDTEDAED